MDIKLMAIRHQYTILCDYVLGPESGKDVFAGIFANIALSKFPERYPQFYIALGFEAGDGDEYSIAIVDPRRKRYPVATSEADPKSPPRVVEHQVTIRRVVIRVRNFNFEKEGIYQVEFRQGKRIIHRSPFGVFLNPPGDEQEDRNDHTA